MIVQYITIFALLLRQWMFIACLATYDCSYNYKGANRVMPNLTNLSSNWPLCNNSWKMHKDSDYGFMNIVTLYARFIEAHLGGGVVSVSSFTLDATANSDHCRQCVMSGMCALIGVSCKYKLVDAVRAHWSVHTVNIGQQWMRYQCQSELVASYIMGVEPLPWVWFYSLLF